MDEHTRQGVHNLAVNCSEIKAGDRLLIYNRFGEIEPVFAELIISAAREAGADCHVLWGPPTNAMQDSLPSILISAVLAADKVIQNSRIDRALLGKYLKRAGPIQIVNTCPTPQSMSTEHARYDFRRVMAICSQLSRIASSAKMWRITTPLGTDISGKICRSSDIANAYFSQDTEASRFIRVFPGEVYTPIGSEQASGTIVTEYINRADPMPWRDPVSIAIEDNRVANVTGSGKRVGEIRNMLRANMEVYGESAMVLDSWHGGMNPKARVPTGSDRSLKGAECSPAMMH